MQISTKSSPHQIIIWNAVILICDWGHPPGRSPDECLYRPISVLNTHLKHLAKILASHTEFVLPSVITQEQTGFVCGRFSLHNVRRLLSVVMHSSLNSSQALVISLDAEKAFYQLEWPYLFLALQKFGLEERFIKLIQILCTSPLSAVITNGPRLNKFIILQGISQGCPLSPSCCSDCYETLSFNH